MKQKTTMSTFPLYDSLVSNIEEKDLTASQKLSFVKKTNKIDIIGRELMYALIKVYEKENENTLSEFPYEGIIENDSITFDLSNFPIKLRQLLYKFLNAHIKKMSEENKLNKVRTK